MQQKLTTTRYLAGFFAVLLIIALVVIWNDHQKIVALQSPAQQNLSLQQDKIREDCSATDADSQIRCADDLQNLSDLLAKFSKTRGGATATVPVRGALNNIQITPLPTK